MEGIKACIALSEQVELKTNEELFYSERRNERVLFSNVLYDLQEQLFKLFKLCEASEVLQIAVANDDYKVQVSFEKLIDLLGYKPTPNLIKEGTGMTFKHYYCEVDSIIFVAVESTFNKEHKKNPSDLTDHLSLH